MLTRKTMAIIFANMHDKSVPDLTEVRSMASLPFGGRYRMIDFLLSSMVNAGISNVGVIAKNNYHSLMDHLGSGRDWDLARKIEGLSIFPPFSTFDYGEIYHGRIGALNEVLSFIRDSKAEYVVLSDCDHLANFDIEGYVEEHIDSNADVSIVCCNLPWNSKMARNSVSVKYDNDFRVTDILSDTRCPEGGSYSMNMFIVGKDILVSLIEDAFSRMDMYFERDVLAKNLDKLNVHAIIHTGYVRRIYDNRSYFEANMSLLEEYVRSTLFTAEKPIYTKVRDEAPCKYGLEAKATNSLIADGCEIEGTVENSVLFRGVKVAKGAVVKNCILMQETVVGEGANLDSVITDKDVTIHKDRRLSGHSTYPLYIKKYSNV